MGIKATSNHLIPIGYELECAFTDMNVDNTPLFQLQNCKLSDSIMHMPLQLKKYDPFLKTMMDFGIHGKMKSLLNGVWLINGGRIHRELTHTTTVKHFVSEIPEYIIEYASPEMLTSDELSKHYLSSISFLENIAKISKLQLLPNTTALGAERTLGFHENYGIPKASGHTPHSIFNRLAFHLATRVLLTGDGGYCLMEGPLISQRAHLTNLLENLGSVSPTSGYGLRKVNTKFGGVAYNRLEIVCSDTPTTAQQAKLMFGSTQLVILLAINNRIPELPNTPLFNMTPVEIINELGGEPALLDIKQGLHYQEILKSSAQSLLEELYIDDPQLDQFLQVIELWTKAINDVERYLDDENIDNPLPGWIHQLQTGYTRQVNTYDQSQPDYDFFMPPNNTRAVIRGTLAAIQSYFQDCILKEINTQLKPGTTVDYESIARSMPQLDITIREWEIIQFILYQHETALYSEKIAMHITDSPNQVAQKIISSLNSSLDNKFQIPSDLLERRTLQASHNISNALNKLDDTPTLDRNFTIQH